MIFSDGQYHAMDREYYEESPAPKLEKPILGVDELGVTVPEKHPVTGGNIIQNVESAIRLGASKLQIVMSTPHTHPMGGRPKAYGKDVRESIRELAKANEVEIEGLEMPTSSMTNLSGWDGQGRGVSEHARQLSLQEVKDAIKFVADIAGGGGVDVWSQEFARNIHDADWNNQGKWKGSFEAYHDEQKYATAHIVDDRTGRVHELPTGQPIFEPEYVEAESDHWGTDVDGQRVMIKKGDWITEDGKLIDPTKGDHLILRTPKWDATRQEFKVKPMSWDDIKARTQEINSRFVKNGDGFLAPEEVAIRTQLDNQWLQSKGQSLYYSQRYNDNIKQRKALRKSLEFYKKLEQDMPEKELWRIMDDDPAFRYSKYTSGPRMKPSKIIEKELVDLDHNIKYIHESSASADARAMEIELQKNHMVALKKYALGKSVESYADAGIAAMDETMHNRHVRADKPLHVGPESGWPQAYGGHPEEFIELITKSRKKMAARLQKERGVSKSEAEQLAKIHIKGCFDTSHVGMWLDHFKKKENETEEQRLARFNGWYKEMVHKMAEADVIGSVQAVDSASGAHGHLPPGQGIFPVVEAVEILKEHGFRGAVVSEGHEEDQFQQGRILLETWRAFGSDVGNSYFSATPMNAPWSDVADTYFGHVNPPPYVVGTYRPSDDWVFWSGVPME